MAFAAHLHDGAPCRRLQASGSFCAACARAGAAGEVDKGRGVTSAGVTPSAHLMPSSIIVWKCGSSQVASGCPQPTLNTRPLPYWRAHTTGKSPSGRRARFGRAERLRIESHDDVHLVARVRRLEHRMLVVEHECGGAPGHRTGKLRILDDDLGVGVELAVHVSADHLAELRPVGEGDAGGVADDESLPFISNERQQVGFLLIRHGAEAARQHEDRVVVVERPRVDAAPFVASLTGDLPLGDQLRVGANHRRVGTRAAADLLDRREGVRDRVVMEAAQHVSHGKEMLLSGPGIGLLRARATALRPGASEQQQRRVLAPARA